MVMFLPEVEELPVNWGNVHKEVCVFLFKSHKPCSVVEGITYASVIMRNFNFLMNIFSS